MAWFRSARMRGFWRWCAAQPALSVWPPDRALLAELGQRLHAIDRGLAFEVCRNGDGVELAISAGGKIEMFDFVRAMVAAAPEMPRLRVVAFRQRGPVGSYELRRADGTTLTSADVWFILDEDAELVSGEKAGLGLHLFVENFPEEAPGPLQEAVYLLLDNALGELDVVTKIVGINWDRLPPAGERGGMSPLTELPAQFDRALGR